MFSFSSGFLFGKPKEEGTGSSGDDDPLKAQLREWKAGIRKEVHGVDRQVREIERSLEKHRSEIKVLMKKNGQQANIKQLAKNIAKGQKMVEQLNVAKAQLNSISMQLQEQASQVRITKTLQKSTAIMQSMGKLINAPAIAGNLRQMAEEMQKAGIIGEMMDEAMEDAMPVEEEEADAVVEGILFEVTAGAMGAPLPSSVAAQSQAVVAPAAPTRTAVAAGGGGGGPSSGLGPDFNSRFDNV